jgi:WD40 repeat protein/DNA-binding SARP family transcriptional activator
MDFRILGPLEVHGDLGAIDVPGRMPRAALVVLLLHANQPVSAGTLARELWGDDARHDTKNVHVVISRLRKALRDHNGIVRRTEAGYMLQLAPDALDLERFKQLVSEGRHALTAGRPDDAGTILRSALALWRGPPLEDVASVPFAAAVITELEEEHQAAIEARVEADLAAGRHAELVAELRRMVTAYPTRERLAGHLMLALYRCGRQAEALDAYREARARLTEQLGIEPDEELHALQDAILHHDPALMLAPATELPHELEVAASRPLAGRDGDLVRLRERWEEARAGRGRLVALVGPDGMGKTRLAAELAVEVHAQGASVLYAAGAGPASEVRDVLARTRDAGRPLLLVVDDADEAGEDVLAAIRDASGGSVLVLATARDHEGLGALGEGTVLYLDLEGLDAAAVAQIAALYTPEQAPEVLPATLLGRSAGVPGRVHHEASDWARRRVGSVARRTAAGRSRLRSMEAELAGGVAQLQTAGEWVGPPCDGGDSIICPFKGLASFEAADAPYFFGRERLVAELVAQLVGAPLLGVIGPSGSGKSSVVRAGLLPALANGVLPGSETWAQEVMRPGEHPLGALNAALEHTGSRRFVLVVDQFEETFTACRDERERGAFIGHLVRAADGDGRVVIALRADFYGRCAEYPALARALAGNQVLVGPMQPEELRRAITCPAQRVGLTVEDDLVGAIVADVQDAPGALPLLSTALLELWQRRDGRRLRLASYAETGGVRGAVARLAEEAFSHLDAEQQVLARRLLLRLVEVDDDGAVERRRLALAELGGGEDVEHVLDLLADRRLVTISEGTAELAHEALLREWPRLRGWIDEDREGLRIERGLRAGAREWRRVGKDDGALYRGARLAEASDWSSRAGHALPDDEREFLAASAARERHDRATRRRRLTVAFGGLAIGLLLIAIVAAVAIDQRNAAQNERDMATSRALGLQSQQLAEDDPEQAASVAMLALDMAPTREAAAALREATSAFRQRAVVRADTTDAWTATVSPDGNRMVTGGTDGVVLLWDVETGTRVGRWSAGHTVVSASSYAPGGGTIALGFGNGTVVITDAALGSRRIVARVKDQKVRSIAFTGDGRRLVAAFADGAIRVLTVDGNEPPLLLDGHEGEVLSVDVSRDGERIASSGADGSVRLWNVQDGTHRILHREAGSKWDVALSPDGDWTLAAGDDGWVRRWNVRTGHEAARTGGGESPLYTVAFSDDGERFAAGGEDGVVRVWADAGTPPVAVLRGQRSRVYDVGFVPQSDTVVTAGDDGTVRLWDASGLQSWTVPGGAMSMDFNRDGSLLATTSDDGTVRVWDTATTRLRARLPGPPGYMTAKFAPSGETLVVANEEASLVRTWPIAERHADVLIKHSDARGIPSARFDPRGERVVYVDGNGRIVVHTLDSGEEIVLRGGPKVVYDAQFSPDGKRVAIAPEDGQPRIWRVDRPDAPERVLRGHTGHLNWLEYGADGRLLTASGDRTVRVWSAHEGPAIVIGGFTQEVTGAAFSADGTQVFSTDFDGALRLWDARSGARLALLSSGPDALYNVVVSREGHIATLDENGVLRVFKCDVCGTLEDVRALALAKAPRPLTEEQRRRLIAAVD